MRSPGWIRVWMMVMLALVFGLVWRAVSVPNERYGTGSSWYCVPGTYEPHTEERVAGYTEPSEAAIQREIERIKGMQFPGSPIEEGIGLYIAAKSNLREPIYKYETTFTCTTYLAVLQSVVMAFFVSLAIAVAFLASRWVVDGFRRNAE